MTDELYPKEKSTKEIRGEEDTDDSGVLSERWCMI
jgi:hypothetical protein